MEQNVLAEEAAGIEGNSGCLTWFDPARQGHSVTDGAKGPNELVRSSSKQMSSRQVQSLSQYCGSGMEGGQAGAPLAAQQLSYQRGTIVIN